MLARQIDVYAEMDRFLDEQWRRAEAEGNALRGLWRTREHGHVPDAKPPEHCGYRTAVL